jgi:hypothetical protein
MVIAITFGETRSYAESKNEADFSQSSIQGEGTFEVYIAPLPLVPDIYTVETRIVGSEQPIIYANSSKETLSGAGYRGQRMGACSHPTLNGFLPVGR